MKAMRPFALGMLLSAVLGVFAPWRATLATPHPSLPPPVVPECLGVNIHFTDPKPGEIEMLAAAGFKWVRMDFTWSATERKPGEYDFSAYDRLVARLDEHQLRAVFILDYGNPLYAEPGDQHPFTSRAGTPGFREAFAKWAVAAVSHFKGRGYLWELWNEPNHAGFWKPKPSPADYAALAKTTAAALRVAGLLREGEAPAEPTPPDAGGVGSAGASPSRKAGECFIGPATSTIDLPFLEECFKAGLLADWDAVSVHPYRQQAPETVEEEYRSLRLLIRKYAPAGKDIPIISGEWGYSTQYPAFAGKAPAARDEMQAKYLARQFLTNIANDVALSIWYDWHDDGTNPTEAEHHFGLVRHEYHAGRDPVYDPKPAYTAMKTLTEQLGGFRFNKRLAETDWARDRNCVLLWQRKSDIRLALWTPGGTKEVILPASNGPLVATLALGEKVEGIVRKEENDPAGLRFTPGTTPAYLSFKDPNPWLQAAATINRLPLEVIVNEPGFAPPMQVAFRNPLQEALLVKTLPVNRWKEGTPKEWNLGPGEALAAEVELFLSTRVEEGETRDFGFCFAPPPTEPATFRPVTVSQLVTLLPRSPWKVERWPAPSGKVTLKISNPTGESWTGVARVAGVGSGKGRTKIVGEAPLQFAEKTFEALVEIVLETNLTDARSMDGMRIVFAAEGRPEFSFWAPGILQLQVRAQDLHAFADGDPLTEGSLAVEVAEPAVKPPIPDIECHRLNYRFGSGWKFAQINPKKLGATVASEVAQAQSALTSKPNEWPTAFGLWVYGDGKGLQARIRFRDYGGQVFQSDGPRIDWVGWRYTMFSMRTTLDKPLAHWGGMKDGVIHYPIEWDAIFLLDNIERKPVEGEIYLSAPTLIY